MDATAACFCCKNGTVPSLAWTIQGKNKNAEKRVKRRCRFMAPPEGDSILYPCEFHERYCSFGSSFDKYRVSCGRPRDFRRTELYRTAASKYGKAYPKQNSALSDKTITQAGGKGSGTLGTWRCAEQSELAFGYPKKPVSAWWF